MQDKFSILSIYQNAKEWRNGGMDIREIRRANLRLLIDQFGTAKALADAAGTDAAYISQIRSEKTKREVGDALARKLEKAAGKEHGWMDQIHGKFHKELTAKDGGAITRHEEEWIEVIRRLRPSDRKRFLDALSAVAPTVGVKKKTAS